jgi:AP-1-like factor
MDSATVKPEPVNSNLTLSAGQKHLLFAALNSNKLSHIDPSVSQSHHPSSSMAPASFSDSPLPAPGSGTLAFEESPFIDYDYDFDADGSFDYDFNNDSRGQMIGNLPGTSSDGDADTHDKRSHPDDDDEEEGGGKRREGDEKSSKKPGRKPLTSEPTSVSHLNCILHCCCLLMPSIEAQGTKPCCSTRIPGTQREAS